MSPIGGFIDPVGRDGRLRLARDQLRATDVVTPAGNGLTFSCNGQAIAGYQSVCSNGLIILTMKDGKQTDPQNVFIK